MNLSSGQMYHQVILHAWNQLWPFNELLIKVLYRCQLMVFASYVKSYPLACIGSCFKVDCKLFVTLDVCFISSSTVTLLLPISYQALIKQLVRFRLFTMSMPVVKCEAQSYKLTRSSAVAEGPRVSSRLHWSLSK